MTECGRRIYTRSNERKEDRRIKELIIRRVAENDRGREEEDHGKRLW